MGYVYNTVNLLGAPAAMRFESSDVAAAYGSTEAAALGGATALVVAY
jgi:hypothetical protein